MMKKLTKKQRGVVSIFVVIFASLLITIATVGFVRVMIQGQQQASTIDLSQSAYDSAQAGVEDAKRAILYCLKPELSPEGQEKCKSYLSSEECNEAIKNILTDVQANDNEITVQSGSGSDNAYDQAYTCTKITMDTNDATGTLTDGEFYLIPLRGVSHFKTVKVSWFDERTDLAGLGSTSFEVAPDIDLLDREDWKGSPPVVRVQLIQFGGDSGIKLGTTPEDIDKDDSSSTLFLRPSTAGSNEADFVVDDRRSSGNTLSLTKCNIPNGTKSYSCSSKITLPDVVGTRNAYLLIGSIYTNAEYQLVLQNGDDDVKFDNVQPVIDSTGRANDMFRRVRAKVMPGSDFTYPNSIYTIGSFCKDFKLTDNKYYGSDDQDCKNLWNE